mmetsp:Transcript_9181/g.29780  ORF Transcript_9181/g.29780 Transcript_9181/m.29780 type:complete len:226 (-) Transcript_9181:2938-3615(-)
MSTSLRMASFLATWSMKTSNSSMTRKGQSTALPRATRSARVVKDRSPPEKELTLCNWVDWSVLSFWKVTSRVLRRWSKASSPEAPLVARISLNLIDVLLEMVFRNRSSFRNRDKTSSWSWRPSSSIFEHSVRFFLRAWAAFRALARAASRFVSARSSDSSRFCFASRNVFILASTAASVLKCLASASRVDAANEEGLSPSAAASGPPSAAEASSSCAPPPLLRAS